MKGVEYTLWQAWLRQERVLAAGTFAKFLALAGNDQIMVQAAEIAHEAQIGVIDSAEIMIANLMEQGF